MTVTNPQAPQPTPVKRPGAQHIPMATWFAIKRDYITGKFASIASAARAHNVNLETVRNHAKAERWAIARGNHFAKLEANLTNPQPEIPQDPPPTKPENTLPQDVQRIDRQIDRFNNLLDTATDARDIEKLTLAITRLHERKRIMLGIPLPGSQRPSRKPARPVARDIVMIEDPQPPSAQPPA